jgi:hypothetical protein
VFLPYNTLHKIILAAISPQTHYTDRASNRPLSAKLVPTYAGREYCVASATDLYGR